MNGNRDSVDLAFIQQQINAINISGNNKGDPLISVPNFHINSGSKSGEDENGNNNGTHRRV